MKFKFTLSLILLFCVKIVAAQSNINYGFFVQPKASIFNHEIILLTDADGNLSYVIGGTVAYQKNKVELKTGLNLNRISVNHTDYSPIFANDAGVGGLGPDFLSSFFTDNFRVFYVGIPLGVNYYFTEKKNLYFDLGGEVLFQVFDMTETFIVESGMPEREISENPTYTPQGFLAKANFGIGYLYEKDDYSIYFPNFLKTNLQRTTSMF